MSQSLVPDVNLNDARAAMMVWIARISREMNLPVDYDKGVFSSSLEILNRVRKQQVDAVALSTLEYRQIAEFLDTSLLVAEADQSKHQYAILLPKASGARELADLRGKRFLMLEDPSTSLAAAWLTSLFAAEGLAWSPKFFGALTSSAKNAQVILPVFFGQADGCLTTMRSFRTMSELNPQIAKRLEPAIVSPELVSNFYIFRKNYHTQHRDMLVSALATLHTNPAGRQLMLLFQVEKLVARGSGCLRDALSVLDQADRARRREESLKRRAGT